MRIDCRDCSPILEVAGEEDRTWLTQVARTFQPGKHVLWFGHTRAEDEPVVFCDWDGTWRCGRYIGALRHEGRTLHIQPRLGLATIRNWLCYAHNLEFVDAPGRLQDDDSFVAELVAAVWGRGLAEAARHGLPALRESHVHRGHTVRGQLAVAQTVTSGALYRQELVSVRRERSLDNPIARTIACAYGVLRRWLGPGQERQWLPQRCIELLPHLLQATGSRPALPSKAELARIRYTPITRCYRSFVQLSWQIAQQRGLFGDPDAQGDCQGVLLDVAELWELYVVAVLRAAARPNVVSHGTREEPARSHLLQSLTDQTLLGELRPDALAVDGLGRTLILDAKYKFLAAGTSREDLYQLSAYMTRYGAGRECSGALLYPEDPGNDCSPTIELKNPWRLGELGNASFLTLPHIPDHAVTKLQDVFFPVRTAK